MRPSVVQRRNTNINREGGRERESAPSHGDLLGTRIFLSNFEPFDFRDFGEGISRKEIHRSALDKFHRASNDEQKRKSDRDRELLKYERRVRTCEKRTLRNKSTGWFI